MKIGKIIVNFFKKVLPLAEESMVLIHDDDFEIKEKLINFAVKYYDEKPF